MRRLLIILIIMLACLIVQAEAQQFLLAIGDKGLINDETYGFIDKNDFFKTMEYVAQEDQPAALKFINAGRRTGRAHLFVKGDIVYCVDVDRTIAKVRLRGEIKEYWISRGYVTKYQPNWN